MRSTFKILKIPLKCIKIFSVTIRTSKLLFFTFKNYSRIKFDNSLIPLISYLFRIT